MAANTSSITPETLITIKVSLNDAVKKLKLPLKDLSPAVLPDKLRTALNIRPTHATIFERYSDSVGGFVTLKPTDLPVYKSLVRAAKAKGKLRLKCSVIPPEEPQEMSKAEVEDNVQCTMPKRSSAALDCRSLGSGIFQYRDARASQQTLVNETRPEPQPCSAEIDEKVGEDLSARYQELTLQAREQPPSFFATPYHAWSVYCNVCDSAMADVHFHCSTCDGGDYDLCEACVSAGKTCPGDHWLIKRSIKDGKVITSTTERVTRKTSDVEVNVPGAFNQQTSIEAPLTLPELKPEMHVPAAFDLESKFMPQPELTRTCNNCVGVFPEQQFVTCQKCPDFDLCIPCHAGNNHGHHPAHAFEKAREDTVLHPYLEILLEPGRNVEHNAFCDGCDKRIFGVRHKCLQCPDWDFCNACIDSASLSHPRHRFAALYSPLPEPQANYVRHFGIFCDGPLCSKKAQQTYIQGVRYKCAVCHDTDFCAACEALPGNHHNHTHPLIKFNTPVKNVNITTINEDARGNVRDMGDKQAESAKPEPKNAAIPVQTVAEIAPTEEKSVKIAQPIDGDVSSVRAPIIPASMLSAVFVKDIIPDGTVIAPGARFVQVWTLRNVGPFVWPAGCSVRYVGGDNMLNVDNNRPNSVASINQAIESSVVAREVQVGEEIAFTIMLKAPMREGKSISYWRLKAADGTPFGHRLWCDIEVKGHKVEPLPLPTIKPELRSVPISKHRATEAARMYRDITLEQLQQRRALRPAEADKSRIEASRLRMNAIREKILQNRAACDKVRAEWAAVATAMEASTPIKKEEPAVVETAVSDDSVTQVEEVKPEHEGAVDSTHSSQMIFPKLEKESPASSMIASSSAKAAYVEDENGHVEDVALPSSPESMTNTVAATPDHFEDVEVLSISSEGEGEEDFDDDDGFLTDEEYDILDASDAETVHSP